MLTALPSIVSTLSPFSEKKLLQIRLDLTKEIGEKRFPYYIKKLNTLTAKIERIINDPVAIMKDDLWDTEFPPDTAWWTESSMLQAYKKQVAFYKSSTGVEEVLKAYVTDDMIDDFVGKAPWMTGQQILFFQAAIGNYFTKDEKLWPVALNIDLTYKQSLRSVERLSSQAEQLGKAALSGAGPFIIKLLQQIGNSSSVSSSGKLNVKQLLDSVFDNVPAMSDAELEWVTSKMKIPEVFKRNLDKARIGSASLAQAHETKDEFDMPMVIKFLKPVYLYYYMCECDFFLTTVWKNIRSRSAKLVNMLLAEQRKPKSDSCDDNVSSTDADLLIRQTRQILLFFVREFAGEFNYTQEAFNTVAGYAIYNTPSQHVRSIQLRNYTDDPYPAIVQTKAPGVSLRQLMKQINAEPPDTRTALYSKVYASLLQLREIWSKNIFWGNGFFHADCHNGNIICPDADTIKQGYPVDLYLIDYGSTGKLTKQEQCRLIDTMLITAKFVDLNRLIPDEPVGSTMSLARALQSLAPDKTKRQLCLETAAQLAQQKSVIGQKASALTKVLTEEQLVTMADDIAQMAKTEDDACKQRKNLKRTGIACFFRKFKKLTCYQQEGLLARLKEPLVIDQHKNNVITSKDFIQHLMTVCDVGALPEIDRFAEMILDYSVQLNFGQLFLDFVRVSSDIGKCTNNSTLMFGRGIAYIGNSVNEMFLGCHDEKQCPNIPFDSVIKSNIMRSPKQVVNFLAGRPVCQDILS